MLNMVEIAVRGSMHARLPLASFALPAVKASCPVPGVYGERQNVIRLRQSCPPVCNAFLVLRGTIYD